MSINGDEVVTNDLIDNDADTCVQLPGSDGCLMDQVVLMFKYKLQDHA